MTPIAVKNPTPTPTTAPVNDLDADTPARLRAVVGKLSRRLTRLARGSGFTQSQLSVLATTVRQGPIKASALAEVEGLHPTMLSRVLGALEEQNLIRRVTDCDDRRVQRVETTAAGRRAHEKLRRERGRVLSDALATLNPSEIAAIEAALPALEALSRAAASQ